MPKPIAIIGTLDTKGHEVAYLRQLIQARGHQTLVIDPGVLDRPVVEAEVTRWEIARAGGAELEALIAAGDKGRTIQTMIEGTRRLVLRLYTEGRLGGVIAMGGGQGTAIGTTAMQALPLGVPKLMVSTIASGRNQFEPYVGTSDVTLMHSVADILGVNIVTRRVFGNAAAAITAMVEASETVTESTKTVVGATMLGLTTPCLLRIQERLAEQDYELVAFHANGTGGRSMERLIEEGVIQGVIDLSLQELIGRVCGGLFDAGPERLAVAGRRGLPQVIVPGGTDYLVLGPLDSLTPAQRDRPLIVHNPNITLIRTSPEEMVQLGHLIADRLNQARGPVAVMIPLGGFSFSDRPGHSFYDPQANMALVSVLEKSSKPKFEIQKIEYHINEPAFADLVTKKLWDLM